MLFVIHKTAQREAIGKQSSFLVHSQSVDPDVIRKFLKRKKRGIDPKNPPTPPHISYRTPSPLCCTEDENTETTDKEHPIYAPTDSRHQTKDLSLFGQSTCSDIATQSLPSGYSVSFMSASDLRRSLPPCSEVPRQPLLPTEFHSAEGFLFKIRDYIGGSIRQKIWAVDTPRPYNGRGWPLPILEFRSHCQAGCELIQARSYVEARRVLSRASALVGTILVSSISCVKQ
jgi:hypothetical protein